jgi:hypothetical protein
MFNLHTAGLFRNIFLNAFIYLVVGHGRGRVRVQIPTRALRRG